MLRPGPIYPTEGSRAPGPINQEANMAGITRYNPLEETFDDLFKF